MDSALAHSVTPKLVTTTHKNIENLSIIDEEFVYKINCDIEHYLEQRPNNRVLLFPPVNNFRRFLIHQTCEKFQHKYNLCTFSVGQGFNRRTVVCFYNQLLHPNKFNDIAVHIKKTNHPQTHSSKQLKQYTKHFVAFDESMTDTAMGIKKQATENRSFKANEMNLYRPPALRNSVDISCPNAVTNNETAAAATAIAGATLVEAQNNKTLHSSKNGGTKHYTMTLMSMPNTNTKKSKHKQHQLQQQQQQDHGKTNVKSKETIATTTTTTTANDQNDTTSHTNQSNNIKQTMMRRERRPDRAVYVPRARRSQTTPPTTTTATTVEIKTSKATICNSSSSSVESSTATSVVKQAAALEHVNEENNTNNLNKTIDMFAHKTKLREEAEEEEEVAAAEEMEQVEVQSKEIDCDNQQEQEYVQNNVNNKMCNAVNPMQQQQATYYEKSETPTPTTTPITNNTLDINNISCNMSDNVRIVDIDMKNVKCEDIDNQELQRASKEINRSNRRIIKQTFISDVLEIPDKLPTTISDAAANATTNDNDDWDAMYDESGECLDPKLIDEITASVGKVKLDLPEMDYSMYLSNQSILEKEGFPHVLEVSNFPAEFKHQDLLMIFSQYKESGFDIKWVDDTHALAVFSSARIAAEVLTMGHPFVVLKPLTEATVESRLKAKKCATSLQPYRPRPETCAALARRLVTGALGVRLKTAAAERENEKRVLKQAKERKLLAAKLRDETWDN